VHLVKSPLSCDMSHSFLRPSLFLKCCSLVMLALLRSYGGNDMGRHMPDRPARREAFWDFIGWRPPPAAKNRNGVYSSVLLGLPPRQVQLILLDTRHERDDHCAIRSLAGTGLPLSAGLACLSRWLAAGLLHWYCRDDDRTVLGKQQWKWFEDQLRVDTPSVRIVVSSIQVLSTNPAMESWGQFPLEQERFVRLLQRASGSSVVIVLSGDVHHGEILKPTSKPRAGVIDGNPIEPSSSMPQPPFHEITSSGLTHDCSKHVYGKLCRPLLEKFLQNRLDGQYFIGRNFGSVEVDWRRQTMRVNVHELTSPDGRVVLTTGSIPLKYRGSASNGTGSVDIVVAPTMDGHLLPYLGMLALIAVVVGLICCPLSRPRRCRSGEALSDEDKPKTS